MYGMISKGSKYIYREKISLKHIDNQLKKFGFSYFQIKKIHFLKKKFMNIFEDNIIEMAKGNQKQVSAFNNGKTDDTFNRGNAAMYKAIYIKEFQKVKIYSVLVLKTKSKVQRKNEYFCVTKNIYHQ